MSRAIRNLWLMPMRFSESLKRRSQPVYRFQREADATVKRDVQPARLAELYTVPGTTSERECRLLYHLARTAQPAGAVVEIGAFKGRSTAFIAEAVRKSGRKFVSVDPHLGGSLEEFRRTVDRFRIEEVATLHRAYSHDIGKDWSEPIAFLWIDGGHKHEIVLQDIRDFTPHLQSGGIVCFDDVGDRFPGVGRALEETLMHDPALEHLGQIKNYALFRRR